MADVPHLAWPFRMGTRQLAQVEQDSLADVQQSVHSYLVTNRGERPLSPEFGREDPTFSQTLNAAQLAREIEESEQNRARVAVTVSDQDGTGRMAVDVRVELAE